MPLNKKGRKIMARMKDQYGAEKGEEVFYRSRNAGTITGVDSYRKSTKSSPPCTEADMKRGFKKIPWPGG